MYSNCLVCRAPFPEGGELEHLPRGGRVAFDLQRGRLWMVCLSCRRWSLVALESRWEALEELEATVTTKARLLSRTDHVALYRIGSMEIVRVGHAEIAEEAWWRYGRQLPERGRMARWMPPLLRRVRFGDLAWVGQRPCPDCGHVFKDLSFADRQILVIRPGAGFYEGLEAGSQGGREDEGLPEGTFSLTRPCPRCRGFEKGGLRLTGVEAEFTLARVMAYQSDLGSPRVTVHAAARLLSDPEGPADLVRVLSRHGKAFGELLPIGLTALEITVNAARERTLLKLKVESLQARWRREEALAALVDGELSPVSRLEALVQSIRGGG